MIKKIIDNIFKKYEKVENINIFKEYFYHQWEDLIKTGILNYAYLSKKQRSNPIIKNYNRRITWRLECFTS